MARCVRQSPRALAALLLGAAGALATARGESNAGETLYRRGILPSGQPV
jgi:hypothetical protein